MLTDTLPNGLRLAISEDRVAPVTAVHVAYGTGTSSEGPREGELAHLFEHMMFEGSRHVAPGEHVALLAAHGGMVDARTHADCTTYASIVPSHCTDLTLWLEAERLAHLRDGLTAESLERQRAVVRNEHLQRRAGVPYGAAQSDLCERLFPLPHPYHTSMARRAELDAASLDGVIAFHERHYFPGNAVLAVCGDVDSARVRDRVAEWFGAVPARPVPPRPDVAYRPLGGEVRETLRAAVPRPRVYAAWRGPGEGGDDVGALLVAVAILYGGQRGRLRRLGREATLVLETRAGTSFLHGWTTPDEDAALAEKEYLAVFDELAESGPDEEEVRRAARLLDTARLTAGASVGGRAHETAAGLLRGAPPLPYDDVTPERVRGVVAEVFDARNRVVLTYLPAGAT